MPRGKSLASEDVAGGSSRVIRHDQSTEDLDDAEEAAAFTRYSTPAIAVCLVEFMHSLLAFV